MSSSKYHREQAQLLAGLALSTNDATEVDRFTLAAVKHLKRAQALEGDPGQTLSGPRLSTGGTVEI